MVKETRYYDVLGVSPNASSEEIRLAYGRLSRQFHPDKNPNGMEQMQEINVSYGILRDDEQRRLYDVYGEAGEAADNYSYDPYNHDMNEDRYHLNYSLVVSMEETYSGFVKRLSIKRYIKCSSCNTSNSSCDECHGIERCERLPYLVKFEAGVPSHFAQQYNLSDDDRYLPLILTVTVIEMEHPVYKRRGVDLIREMPLDFNDAIIGFQKVFTTIDKRKVLIKKPINETTQDMEKVIVKSEGFVDFFNPENGKGDLIIFFRIANWEKLKDLNAKTVELMTRTIPAMPPVTCTTRYKAYQLNEEEKRVPRTYLPSQADEGRLREYRQLLGARAHYP